jgi:hypothetical protein
LVTESTRCKDVDLEGLVDLDDLTSYKAVLLAEAARLRFTQRVFFPSFLPSFPSAAGVAAMKNKQG